MSVSPHSKYPGVWVIRVYADGRKTDPKTGKPSNKRVTILHEGDEASARIFEAEIKKSHRGESPRLLAPSLEEALPKFLEYYKNNSSEKTVADFLQVWRRHLAPVFGKLRPVQITAGMVEQYKSKRVGETYLPGKPGQLLQDDKPGDTEKRKIVSKRTITKELVYLSAFCTWMARPEINLAAPLSFKIKGWGKKFTTAPMPGILTRREVVMILRRSERQYRPIFAVCYYAGLRRSEALNLTAQDVFLSQGYIVIRGKGNKQRIVPIHRKLKTFLRKRITSGFLFLNKETGKPFDDVKKALSRAAQAIGVEGMHLHLLRHAFGTHSIMSGISPRALQLMLGHSSMATTEIYSRLANDFLGIEMEKFGGGALKSKKQLTKCNGCTIVDMCLLFND